MTPPHAPPPPPPPSPVVSLTLFSNVLMAPRGQSYNLDVLAVIKAPPPPPPPLPIPLPPLQNQSGDNINNVVVAQHVVVLADVSGSMEDAGKLQSLKTALRAVVGRIAEHDKLTIVAYNACVRTVYNDDDDYDVVGGRQKAFKAIDALYAYGSTDISQAVLAAFMAFDAGVVSDQKSGISGGGGGCSAAMLRTVLLMTDGQDTVLRKTARVLEKIGDPAPNNNGVAIHAFGFGADANVDLLDSIARKWRGVYHFVERGCDLTEAFTSCVSGASQTCADAVEIRLFSATGLDVLRSSANGGGRQNQVLLARDGSRVLVKLDGTLRYNETRTIRFECSMPANVSESFVDIRAEVSFRAAGAAGASACNGRTRITSKITTCRTNSVAAVVEDPVGAREIVVEKLREQFMSVVESCKHASSQTSTRRLERVEVQVNEYAASNNAANNSPLSTAFTSLQLDLRKCLERARDSTNFASTGSAYMASTASAYTQQRSAGASISSAYTV